MITRKHIRTILAYITLLAVIIQLAAVVLSWLLGVLWPDSGLLSLLSQEGIRWMVGLLPDVLLSDTFLSLVYASIAGGVCYVSRLFHDILRIKSVKKVINDGESRDEVLRKNGENMAEIMKRVNSHNATNKVIAFQITFLTALVGIVLLLYLIFGHDTILLSSTGTFRGSSLSAGLVPLLSAFFMLISVVYGACVSAFRSVLSVFDAMILGIKTIAPLLVAYVFIAQCYYSLLYVFGQI